MAKGGDGLEINDVQFGDIISQYERLVYTICYQLCKDHHISEDLCQETFISAYKHIDKCPEDNIKAWLAKIAANKAKDHLKSAYNRRIQTTGEGILPDNKPVMFIQEESPEDISISKETIELIKDEINALKEPYKFVSQMFFIEEKTVDEIAQILERPPKTVHTQLYRAKNLLKERIKKEA